MNVRNKNSKKLFSFIVFPYANKKETSNNHLNKLFRKLFDRNYIFLKMNQNH